jgi:osmotically inducible protein OsmC
MALDKTLYTAQATSTGGRAGGHSKSSDGRLEVNLDTPKAMGGNDGPGTNPEQLFAAGYSACFLGAVKAVARKQNVQLPADASITADVGFGPLAGSEGKRFGISAALAVSLPGMDRAQAQALVEAAHQVCPYSNATRGNMDVTLTVV